MRKLVLLSLGIALPIVYLTVSCSKDDDTNNKPPVVQQQVQLKTSATLGNYLADKDGRTLYFFSNDFNGQNNCAGQCELLWPYYYVPNLAANQLGAGLKLSDFDSLTAANGKKQLTYKGWPLYYYAPVVNGTNTMEAPGLTSGEGIGGIW